MEWRKDKLGETRFSDMRPGLEELIQDLSVLEDVGRPSLYEEVKIYQHKIPATLKLNRYKFLI